MLSLAANALAFSPPASLSRRDVLSFGAGAVGAAAMVQFPTVANAADKPAYLMTDEEKEASKKATTSVQAKMIYGVHFSVWSLRPATTSVP